MAAARELAAAIVANGPLAIAGSKRILVRRRRLDRGRRRGSARARSSGPIFASEDAREGATAFAEKRPPVWRGR